MRIIQNVKQRVRLGNERFCETGYFEHSLTRSRAFRMLSVWGLMAVLLVIFIVVRFWPSLSAFEVYLICGAAICEVGIWIDMLTDHRRVQEAIRKKDSADVTKQALNLASGQAFSFGLNCLGITCVLLFVLVMLLARFEKHQRGPLFDRPSSHADLTSGGLRAEGGEAEAFYRSLQPGGWPTD